VPKVDLQGLEVQIIDNGRVEGHEIEVLRKALFANGSMAEREAVWLVEVHKRIQYRTRGFEQFFYQTIKDYLLADGKVGAKETEFLRNMLLYDDRLVDEERKFLKQLKGEAKQLSAEFEAFFGACMKYPPEQRTSGGR
jgi:hypothetical protein